MVNAHCRISGVRIKFETFIEMGPEGVRQLREWLRSQFGDYIVQTDPIREETFFGAPMKRRDMFRGL